MNTVSRGIRNAFRNSVRAIAIVVILGLSIGLALTMLVAQKAVDNKIKSVKSSIGNTITVTPAGFSPGNQSNNALSTSQLTKVAALAHVSKLTETLTDRQPTTGSSLPNFGGRAGDSATASTTTSLTSPVTLNTNGPRFFMGGGASSDANASFSLPVSFLGTTTPNSVDGTTISVTKGKTIDGTADTNEALISGAMASKNNLPVGGTFTAYNATLTVSGIFDTSNQAAENTVVLSLPALQRLSGQSGVVTSATVTVDSLDNLSAVTDRVKSALGDSADVTSAEEQADSTVKPLNSVKTVSTFSLIGAVVAGAVIILLVMIIVVRERKREIGVIKAIGGSNLRIVSEFMVEALTLAVLGALVGLGVGVIGGQPVTKALVDNSTSSSASTNGQGQAAGPGPGGNVPMGGSFSNSADPAGGPQRGFSASFRNNGAVRGLDNIKAQIGWTILLEGFGAAVLIAVVGSALAAGLISRVRPSIVMRTE